MVGMVQIIENAVNNAVGGYPVVLQAADGLIVFKGGPRKPLVLEFPDLTVAVFAQIRPKLCLSVKADINVICNEGAPSAFKCERGRPALNTIRTYKMDGKWRGISDFIGKLTTEDQKIRARNIANDYFVKGMTLRSIEEKYGISGASHGRLATAIIQKILKNMIAGRLAPEFLEKAREIIAAPEAYPDLTLGELKRTQKRFQDYLRFESGEAPDVHSSWTSNKDKNKNKETDVNGQKGELYDND